MKKRPLLLGVGGLIALWLVAYPLRAVAAYRLINAATMDLLHYQLGQAERRAVLAKLITPLNPAPGRLLKLPEQLLASSEQTTEALTALTTIPRLSAETKVALNERTRIATVAASVSEVRVAFQLAEDALALSQPRLALDLVITFEAAGQGARDYWRLRGDALRLLHQAESSSRLITRHPSKPSTFLEQAIASYEQALKLDIDHQPTLETLTALYRAAGQNEAAAELEKQLQRSE